MPLLTGFRVLQLGPGLAAAVCARLLADTGATIERVAATTATPLAEYLNRGPQIDDKSAPNPGDTTAPDLIVTEGSPATLAQAGHDPATLRLRYPTAAIVLIAPFGQTGPRAEDPATDLTLFFASGIARMLTGQVDDLAEPPMAPVGQHAAFIGGIAAACAGMHAALTGTAGIIDVSIQEALATLAMTELTRAGQTGSNWSRKRVSDGNGATVCILPASDGYAAISPREEKQWAAWLVAMGSPAWGADPRFARKADRVANWDALHALMAQWSRQHPKQWIADTAQAAHVPSFPLREPLEQLASPQLAHRGFFLDATIAGRPVRIPSLPFSVASRPPLSKTAPSKTAPPKPAPSKSEPSAALPLAGIRVLDFSWVIAGPTATRYLAAMGADVIKVEAPGRGDPGRGSELHTVLGQAKKAIVLDLKQPQGRADAQALAARSDVVIENFATGVMDRLDLGAEALQALNPGLIYVSASGLGRTGPESHAVAYGTLLQCYAGFAGLNRHPGNPPRVGMAWLDPMCGLMLAYSVAAALWHRRRTHQGARIDFSMIEAMLWTMAAPLLSAQLGQDTPITGRVSATPGNDARENDAGGNDAWVATDDAHAATATLARAADLVADPHLQARGFWDRFGNGVLPGLPWQASFGRAVGDAPALGADTEAVLREIRA
jgi:crotonobetainyl-CoA:carnitine CoA-transferase CaiB-like acyl-CoA transferase